MHDCLAELEILLHHHALLSKARSSLRFQAYLLDPFPHAQLESQPEQQHAHQQHTRRGEEGDVLVAETENTAQKNGEDGNGDMHFSFFG
jgi:hypothetical protein